MNRNHRNRPIAASAGTSNGNIAASTSSSSRSSLSPAMSAALISLLECPVCFHYILPPIFQCRNGHLVCRSCHSKLIHCPICRIPLLFIRNFAMEKVAYMLKFPCKNSFYGCTASLACITKAQHEEQCFFRTYLCPDLFRLCKWEGPLHKLAQHLMTTHNCLSLVGEQIRCQAEKINEYATANWAILQLCFNQHFWVVLRKHEGEFLSNVYFFGSREQSYNFGYRIELSKVGESLSYQSVSRPIVEGVSSHGLIFSQSTALNYIENGMLTIRVTIFKL